MVTTILEILTFFHFITKFYFTLFKEANFMKFILAIILLFVFVRYQLRVFFVKKIFTRIDNDYETLGMIHMYFAMRRRSCISDNYFWTQNEYRYYNEQYELLKKLTDFLLESRHPIQNYLMTKEEKEKCSSVFKEFEEVEQECIRTKKEYEIAKKEFLR